jgi:hypothetical protein
MKSKFTIKQKECTPHSLLVGTVFGTCIIKKHSPTLGHLLQVSGTYRPEELALIMLLCAGCCVGYFCVVSDFVGSDR